MANNLFQATTQLLFIGGFAHGRVTAVPDGQETMDLPVPAGHSRVETGALRGAVLLETLAIYHRRSIEVQTPTMKYKRDLMVLAGVSPQEASSLLSQLLIFAWVSDSPPEPRQGLGWGTRTGGDE